MKSINTKKFFVQQFNKMKLLVIFLIIIYVVNAKIATLCANITIASGCCDATMDHDGFYVCRIPNVTGVIYYKNYTNDISPSFTIFTLPTISTNLNCKNSYCEANVFMGYSDHIVRHYYCVHENKIGKFLCPKTVNH